MKCHEAVNLADKEDWTAAECHALITHVGLCKPCGTFYARLAARDRLMPVDLQAKYIQQGKELAERIRNDPETQTGLRSNG